MPYYELPGARSVLFSAISTSLLCKSMQMQKKLKEVLKRWYQNAMITVKKSLESIKKCLHFKENIVNFHKDHGERNFVILPRERKPA